MFTKDVFINEPLLASRCHWSVITVGVQLFTLIDETGWLVCVTAASQGIDWKTTSTTTNTTSTNTTNPTNTTATINWNINPK